MVITKENFEAQVLHQTQPVLLDFWAEWCGPCRMLSPVLEELEPLFPQVKFGKINVDQQPELAAQFGIESIPALLLIKGSAITASSVGYRDRASLQAWLEEVL